MNKIQSYSTKSVDELVEELDDLTDDIKELSLKIEETSKLKYELQAENKSYMYNLSFNDFQIKKSQLTSLLQSQKSELNRINNDLDKFKAYPDIKDVSKTIGNLDAQLSIVQSNLASMGNEYEKIINELNSLKDKSMMSSSEDHIQVLQETYQSLLKQDKEYQVQLYGFKCDYSSAYLSGLLGDLNTINVLINEVVQYDSDIINTLYGSDSSVIGYSKEKIEIL